MFEPSSPGVFKAIDQPRLSPSTFSHLETPFADYLRRDAD